MGSLVPHSGFLLGVSILNQLFSHVPLQWCAPPRSQNTPKNSCIFLMTPEKVFGGMFGKLSGEVVAIRRKLSGDPVRLVFVVDSPFLNFHPGLFILPCHRPPAKGCGKAVGS